MGAPGLSRCREDLNSQTSYVYCEFLILKAVVAPFDRHAGVGETSAYLYLTPSLVDLSAERQAKVTLPPDIQPLVEAGDPTATQVFLAEGLKAEATGKHTLTREMTDTGSGSRRNPSAATAASGKAQVDAMVSASVQFIERWKQLRPVGTP